MFKSPKPQSLETYLARIARELRDLPAQARADEMREIESHLDAIIEQRGDVAAAIAQFGSARKVGRDLRRAWEPEPWWRAFLALSFGMAIWTLFNIVGKELLFFYLAQTGIDRYVALTGAQWTVVAAVTPYLQLFGAFTALATGYAMGFISPKRGVIVAGLAATFIVSRQILQVVYSSGTRVSPSVWEYVTIFLLISTGAYLSSRLGKKRAIRIAK